MDTPTQGRFIWHELSSLDLATSEAFFGALFDWRFADAGDQRVIHSGGSDIGAVSELESSPDAASYWTGQVTVDDLEGKVVVWRSSSL